jgi:hypothetical protein
MQEHHIIIQIKGLVSGFFKQKTGEQCFLVDKRDNGPWYLARGGEGVGVIVTEHLVYLIFSFIILLRPHSGGPTASFDGLHQSTRPCNAWVMWPSDWQDKLCMWPTEGVVSEERGHPIGRISCVCGQLKMW